MVEETLTAIPVHPSNLDSLRQKYGPLNTFMFAGNTDLEPGTFVVILTVTTPDPFEPGWTRLHTWHWNLTAEQLNLRFEVKERQALSATLIRK